MSFLKRLFGKKEKTKEDKEKEEEMRKRSESFEKMMGDMGGKRK